jgi:hypothetical protein
VAAFVRHGGVMFSVPIVLNEIAALCQNRHFPAVNPR